MAVIGAIVILIFVAELESLAFIGVRLSLDAEGHHRRARIIAALYWLLSAAVLGAAIAGSVLGPPDADNEPRIPRPVVIALVATYAPKIVLALLTLLELIRRAAAGMVRRALALPAALRPGWLTRTRVLPRVGLALAVFLFGTILWDATLGRSDVKVYRHEVVFESLPAEFDGLRIVHLSDIHVSSLDLEATRLADRLVGTVDAERPDVVVFTGDYGTPYEFERGPDVLGRLSSRLGKFAVLGNHDFGVRELAADNWTSEEDKRRKIEALTQAFKSRGFTLLVNDAAVLSRDAGAIAVLGVGPYEPHQGFDDADLAAAERSAGTVRFRLLLAHSPQYWEDTVRGRRAIDLTLVGHTHGAQMGFGIGPQVWSPAAFLFRYWGGLYQHGRQYLNVNRGTGYVGLPFRLNMPADVSLIVVRSKRTE